MLDLLKDFEKQLDFEREMLEEYPQNPYWKKSVSELEEQISKLREDYLFG